MILVCICIYLYAYIYIYICVCVCVCVCVFVCVTMYICMDLPHTHITLPNNSFTNILGNDLNKLEIKTVLLSFKTICEILHCSPRCNIVSDAGVYCIPSKNCKLTYIPETSSNIHKRSYEHRRDIRISDFSNPFLQHISKNILDVRMNISISKCVVNEYQYFWLTL